MEFSNLKIYCVDKVIGATGPTGPAAGLNAYGGMYSTSSQTFPQQDEYITIKLDTPMEAYGVTGENNAVKIIEGGKYEITYNVIATLTKAGDLVIGVKENDQDVTGSSSTITLPDAGMGMAAKNIIARLTDLSSISLAIISTTSDDGGTINQASLSLKLLD